MAYSLPESLQGKFNKDADTGCWLWFKATTKDGYGLIRINGKGLYVHRLVYEFVYGEIPKGKVVRHKCDIRNCLNPSHLVIGTYLDNSQDMVKRGRRRNGNDDKTVCVNGHDLTESNTYHYQRKGRRPERACMICRTHADRRYKLRKKGNS